jgi:predicted ATPase
MLTFRVQGQAFAIEDEGIDLAGEDRGSAYAGSFYRYMGGGAVLGVKGLGHRSLNRGSIATDQSILAQRRDPDQYPELAYISDVYNSIRIYREWCLGRNTILRTPQPTDMRNDRLEEDFSNLGLFLNRLRRDARTKQALIARLRDLYAGLDDFDISVEGGTVQVFLTEGDFTIPATRLSDGTLRYLCLLAILCDPNPPRVVCIEEPELGLHPDLLPNVADLLVEASKRTQLIVTTHSDVLVDAMTEQPGSILVCEKHDRQTQIKRLDFEPLQKWLEQYRLGELWTRGELGGTRW